jgi:TolB-like protein
MRNVMVGVLILLLAGCASQEAAYIKDGKEYGVTGGLFRDRWWNYYERGNSFAEGEFYEEAIKDLETAIEKRRDDHWRSRTYGMHFVNYFPHRELGAVYYKLQRYHDAEQELENSLKTAESAKAKYFLNKARKAILEETGADKLSPTIKINHPLDGTITNNFSIMLDGEAEDDHFVSSLAVGVIPVPLELSAKKVSLEREVSLKRGINEISIQAVDLTGKTTEKLLKIKVDREGPLIIIEDHKQAGQKVVLTGVLTDSTGITSFTINGQNVPIALIESNVQDFSSGISGQEAEFHQEIDLQSGTEAIVMNVADIAGNVTTGEMSANPDRPDSIHSTTDTGLNGLPLLASSGPANSVFVPEQYTFTGTGLGMIIDNVSPVIHLKDLAAFQTIYTDSLFLEGSVTDTSKIKSLFINGESVLKRKGKKVFFNYLTGLKEGVNKFLVEAVDIFGNRSQKVVEVNRKIQIIRQLGSRMSISILPLESKGEKSVSSDAVYESLIAAFVNQRRFHLIERERMKEVLSELKLSQTELADPGTASKIGKIVVADAILTGTIYESDDSIEILTRLVDTETSNIMEAKDMFHEDRSLRGIKGLTEGLALKYKQSFPLLEGMVIKKDGKAVITDLGEDKRIKRDMGLILFRDGEGIRHPDTGKVLGAEPIELGEAKVENVYENISRAVIKKGKPVGIRIKDMVITK